MPNSNRAGSFGQRGGTVTVIEQPVMRNYLRKAKIVFWIVLVAGTLLSASILSSKWQPVLALIVGALGSIVVAAVVASVVAAWPVIRVIWWWLPELAFTSGLVTGWAELASHTGLILRLTVVASVVGIPAGIAPVRRYLCRLAWCQVSRHRIRTCFNEFIVTNRTGSLPLVLGARPTPAGERLWVILRPGLSLPDIQQRADKIAAGCWADSVLADRASASNAALVRIDIKRRDPLTVTNGSPLKTVFGNVIPARKPAGTPPPVALDLTDVQVADVTLTPAKNGNGKSQDRPAWPNIPARRDAGPASPPEADDITEWI
jgi:hypothetical protein